MLTKMKSIVIMCYVIAVWALAHQKSVDGRFRSWLASTVLVFACFRPASTSAIHKAAGRAELSVGLRSGHCFGPPRLIAPASAAPPSFLSCQCCHSPGCGVAARALTAGRGPSRRAALAAGNAAGWARTGRFGVAPTQIRSSLAEILLATPTRHWLGRLPQIASFAAPLHLDLASVVVWCCSSFTFVRAPVADSPVAD